MSAAAGCGFPPAPAVTDAMLDGGMDPQFRDSVGRTLLHRIHQFGHTDVLTRLLSAGAVPRLSRLDPVTWPELEPAEG